MNNRKWISVLCTVLVIAVFVYLFNDTVRTNKSLYDTQVIDEVVEQEKLELKAFIVRDEQYINQQASGTVVPLIKDGMRVASGDAVARVCALEKDAADITALTKAQESLERYQELSEQTELNALDMEKLNKEIEDCFSKLAKSVNSGNFESLSEDIEKYESKLASRQILKDGMINLTDKFNELNEEIKTYTSKNISSTDIAAPLSGYYISGLDGYENTVDYDKISELTVSSVQELFEKEPAEVTGKLGKIVGSYKWYLVTVMDSKYKKTMNTGDKLKMNMPSYGFKSVQIVTESISEADNDKVVVVFSCNMMNETYANMRVEDIELVFNEYTGYKVNSSAIRTVKLDTPIKNPDIENLTENDVVDSLDVVYIVRGDIVNVRRIEVLYSCDDYVIVANDTRAIEGYNPIKRYDEVILKGRNLSDGKSIS